MVLRDIKGPCTCGVCQECDWARSHESEIDMIEALSTALEETAEGLHHEAHSVYTSWRTCDDSRCRRAAELI